MNCGHYKDSCVLFESSLLPSKDSNFYVYAFQHIVNYCSLLSLIFFPSEICMDFEDGI